MPTNQQIDEFNLFFTGLRTECLKKIFTKYQSEIIKNELKAGKYAGTMLQEVYDNAMQLRRSEMKDQYWFITICPYEDIEFQEFQKVVDKVLTKKWMKRYIYVYEQRQSEIGKSFYGFHTHIIVQRDGIAKSDVIREVFNTCKNICGSKQSIDVKLLTTQHDLEVRLNYILGQKAPEDKRQKQTIDVDFRKAYNLQKYYFSGEWELQRYTEPN